jgi:hypothetical protein
MSDYIPNPPPERDPRWYDHYDDKSTSRGIGLVLGILVVIGLVAGIMVFEGPRDRSTEVAQNPVINQPLPKTLVPPLPTSPVPTSPAPAEPQSQPKELNR